MEVLRDEDRGSVYASFSLCVCVGQFSGRKVKTREIQGNKPRGLVVMGVGGDKTPRTPGFHHPSPCSQRPGHPPPDGFLPQENQAVRASTSWVSQGSCSSEEHNEMQDHPDPKGWNVCNSQGSYKGEKEGRRSMSFHQRSKAWDKLAPHALMSFHSKDPNPFCKILPRTMCSHYFLSTPRKQSDSTPCGHCKTHWPVKATVRYHISPTRRASVKKTDSNKCWRT